jgi:Protein of unknown function (DUF2442)
VKHNREFVEEITKAVAKLPKVSRRESEAREYVQAKRAKVVGDRLLVLLDNGKRLDLPLSWFPVLPNAPRKPRENVRVRHAGLAVVWPDLGIELGVNGLAYQSGPLRLRSRE